MKFICAYTFPQNLYLKKKKHKNLFFFNMTSQLEM